MKKNMADRLTIKKHFVTEKIEGKINLFDIETSTFFSFNDTGTYIFTMLKKGTDEEKIVESLTKKYQIDKAKAKKDVSDFVKMLLRNKIVSFSKQTKRSK